MGILNSGISAIGKLAAVVLLAVAFFLGLVGVVYMSLQGSEVKVPEIVGKDFHESEKELALLGLKIRRRADRASTEKPDTILEQLPRPGETVKTGQTIRVVIAKPSGESDETPSTLKKSIEEDDTEKIEEMISDKPKKAKANSNTNKKKADTTRDVMSNTATSTTNSDTGKDNSNKKEPGANNNSDKGNKDTTTGPPAQSSPPSAKPTPKPRGADRPRMINRP